MSTFNPEDEQPPMEDDQRDHLIPPPVPHLQLTREEAFAISDRFGISVDIKDERIPVVVDNETAAITAIFPKSKRAEVLAQLNLLAEKLGFYPYTDAGIRALGGDPELDSIFVAFDDNVASFP